MKYPGEVNPCRQKAEGRDRRLEALLWSDASELDRGGGDAHGECTQGHRIVHFQMTGLHDGNFSSVHDQKKTKQKPRK